MDPSAQKEQFSIAFLQTIVSAAGFSLYKPATDYDSIDWGIASDLRTGSIIAPRLEIQLKSTAQDVKGQENIHFPLKLKNYNDLRLEGFCIPRILILLLLPEDPLNWIRHNEDETCLQHGAYWMSLRGLPPTENKTTVTLQIPRTNQFTPAHLQAIMEAISQGQRP